MTPVEVKEDYVPKDPPKSSKQQMPVNRASEETRLRELKESTRKERKATKALVAEANK